MPNLISALAVVHNEGEYLEESFSHLKDYVSEFVVIDQGSTDNTVEIARQFTDKVYLFPRVYYPFAYMAHAALMARWEWVLKVDPDERWDTQLLKRFGELIRPLNFADMYCFRIWYGGDDKSHAARLWRKSKVLWTDSFDAIPYNEKELDVVKDDSEGRIRNLRTRESSGERYRVEGSRRLLARYGDTEVEPYKHFCEYYRDIIAGESQ